MNHSNFNIRPAEKTDCEEIERLIQELAVFEKYPEGMKIDASVLKKDGFDSQPPLFSSLVLELSSRPGHLVGYALYFNTYSTWEGKTLYLEDLYVSPDVRGKKLGSALFKAVAKIAAESSCARMDFSVLKWNPARSFYEAHGAVEQTDKHGWHLYRIDKESLQSFRTSTA